MPHDVRMVRQMCCEYAGAIRHRYQLCRGFLSVLIAVALVCGCKPEVSSQQHSSFGYFKTPFQSESQFIVEAIVSDLAEQTDYAAKHRLPEEKYFSVKGVAP